MKTKKAAKHTSYQEDFPTIVTLSDDEKDRIEWRTPLDVEATKDLYRAAPDLLEAAKLASNNPLSYEKWMPQIIAAIRKAEGSL